MTHGSYLMRCICVSSQKKHSKLDIIWKTIIFTAGGLTTSEKLLVKQEKHGDFQIKTTILRKLNRIIWILKKSKFQSFKICIKFWVQRTQSKLLIVRMLTAAPWFVSNKTLIWRCYIHIRDFLKSNHHHKLENYPALYTRIEKTKKNYGLKINLI